MKRPDPRTFAQYSYFLAIASGGVIILALIFGLIPATRGLTQIIWLALITSGIGAFLAYAARKDFEKMKHPPEDSVHQARIGWRNNLFTFGVLALMAVLAIVMNLFFAAR